MEFILMLILGGIAGALASAIMKSNNGALMDIILGIVGAVVGGFLASLFNYPGVTGFNLYSLVVSVVGSVVLISIGRVLSGNSVDRI